MTLTASRAQHPPAFSLSHVGLASAKVETQWIARELEAFAKITETPGRGITRLAYTETDRAARARVVDAMTSNGLDVRTDAVGNIIGRLPGKEELSPIATGSHVDSVPNGGNFDGLVGVVGALAAARAIREAGIATKRPIEVISFASEEAPRFGQSSNRFGSRVMAGLFPHELAFELRDKQGISLAEALAQFGFDPARIGDARRTKGEVAGFIELHIEQGDELATSGHQLGLVTRITGTTRYRLRLRGQADHSGGAPMARRRDALSAAAEVILAAEQIANSLGHPLVATVGTVEVRPGSISVVPGEALIGVDIRDVRDRYRDAAKDRLLRQLHEIGRRRGIETDVHVIRDDAAVRLPSTIRSRVRAICRRLGIDVIDLASRTGHDTTSMSHITQTGMILVRNTSGRSHCPEEQVDVEDVAAGARALTDALVALAEPISAPPPAGR